MEKDVPRSTRRNDRLQQNIGRVMLSRAVECREFSQ